MYYQLSTNKAIIINIKQNNMMLITHINIELSTNGIGLTADVIITRNKERAVVPVSMFHEFHAVYEIINESNKAIKRFIETCEREYNRHLISDRDRQITKDFIKHYPLKWDECKKTI